MGFFGRGIASEKVPVAGLEDYLNLEFNARMKPLEAKASGILGRFNATKVVFLKACDQLETLDKEPNIEYGFAGRANYFKSLKTSYARALKNVMSAEWEHKESGTIYSRYNSELIELEGMVTSALQTNMEFKQVFVSYGNDLGALKRNFAVIEQLKGELRSEIDLRSRDFKEYEETLGKIRDLVYVIEDLKGLERELHIIQETKTGSAGEHERAGEMRKELETRLAARAQMASSLSSYTTEIETAVGPLDRVAKKFDYTSGSMTKITALVQNPVTAFVHGEGNYEGFVSSVKALGKKVEKDEIDVKGKERVMKAVYDITGGEVYKSVLAARQLISELATIDPEIDRMKTELRTIESGAESRTRLAAKAEEIKKLEHALERDKIERIASISEMFMRYYKKKIEVLY